MHNSAESKNVITTDYRTIGMVAAELSMPRWRLAYLIDRGDVPGPSLQAPGRRLFSEADVARIQQALAMHPDQFKAMAYLGEFLYYQGRLEEAEPILRRAVELGRDSGDEVAVLMSAFLYAARGQRDKIDSNLLREKPENVADGDRAYWIGSVYALLGDKTQALAWLRRAIDLGNHNYPWFVRDKNYDKLRGDRDYERMLTEIRNYADKYRQEFGASSF